MDNVKFMIKQIRSPKLWSLINENDRRWIKELDAQYKANQWLSSSQEQVVINIYKKANKRRKDDKEARKEAYEAKQAKVNAPKPVISNIIIRRAANQTSQFYRGRIGEK